MVDLFKLRQKLEKVERLLDSSVVEDRQVGMIIWDNLSREEHLALLSNGYDNVLKVETSFEIWYE